MLLRVEAHIKGSRCGARKQSKPSTAAAITTLTSFPLLAAAAMASGRGVGEPGRVGPPWLVLFNDVQRFETSRDNLPHQFQ